MTSLIFLLLLAAMIASRSLTAPSVASIVARARHGDDRHQQTIRDYFDPGAIGGLPPDGRDARRLASHGARLRVGRPTGQVGLPESAPTPAILSRRGKCRENSTRSTGCSADQTFAFLPQPPENARLGDQDRVYRQAQGLGHFGGRPLRKDQEVVHSWSFAHTATASRVARAPCSLMIRRRRTV